MTATDTTLPRIKPKHWERIREFIAAAEFGAEGPDADAIRLKRRGLPVRVLIVANSRTDATDAMHGATEHLNLPAFSASQSRGKISFPRGSWIRIVDVDSHLRGLRCDVAVVDHRSDMSNVEPLLSDPHGLGIMIHVASGTEVQVGAQ